MSTQQQQPQLSTLSRFAAAGIAASFAEVCTLPLDTAKVRLQIQVQDGAVRKYRGLFGTIGTIAVEEGPQGLWKGLSPGVMRQLVFATLRIGLYDPVRNFFHSGEGPPPLYKKIAAGLTTGAIGIAVANPTDVVKIRLQAEGKLAPGVARRYKGTLDAFRRIAIDEGVRGLWKGVGPNMMRNSIISAAELASYDEVKQRLLATGWFEDNLTCHLSAGLSAGFIATVVGSPVDVTKTRVMNQTIGKDGSREYKNALDCMAKILKNEGLGGFYKGFLPNFGRIGTWNVVMFLSFEYLKKKFATSSSSS